GVGARMPETDRHLERARSDAELGAYGDVAGAGAVVLVGHEPIRVVQLDVDIGAAVVTHGRAVERPDDADPDVLLSQQQRRWVRVYHLSKVALRARRQMRGGLHVEADVGELRRERAGDDERVL